MRQPDRSKRTGDALRAGDVHARQGAPGVEGIRTSAIAWLLLSLAVLVHFWDTPHRTLVAWLIAGVWTVGWAAMLMSLVSVVHKAGNGFALTRRELAQDWRDIKERL